MTHKLASYAAETDYENFPKNVVNKAKLLILDAIGCMISGSKTLPSKIIIQILKELGGNPQSTIFGDGQKVNCVQSGYINSYSCDALDFEDTLGHLGHPAATIIPAALSVGESFKRTGRDIIEAVILGYEISVRIAFAKRPSWLYGYPPKGSKPIGSVYSWHSFGAGIAAGKLLNLDSDLMANCMGLTAAATPLISKTYEEGGSKAFFKGYNFAEDTSAGIMGALLTNNGFLGCDTILDGHDGFWIMCGSDRCDFDRMTQMLGEEYEIMKIGFKPWPCCRSIHPTCDAIQSIIKEKGINDEQIKEILVKTRWSAMFNQNRPKHLYDAQFSIPWAASMVIIDEKRGLDWYKDEHFQNKNIINLMDKVRVMHDPEADRLHQFPMRKWISTVIISTNGGEKYTKYIDIPKGEPENPMTSIEIKEKFKIQASSIGFNDKKIGQIINSVENLEKFDDITKLTEFISK